jgi:large subunit ribosomal protein L18
MKRSKTRIVPHRRKREGKTDYRLRLRLLKSRKPRFVVRKSLKGITCQIVRYEREGDKILVSSHSRELGKLGWKFHGGNVPSAYLTGMLCAEKARKHKISQVILDMGLYRSTPGNRLYSALKGAVDGGLEIPHSGDIFPKQERISGQHIAEYAEKLKKERPNQYRKVFSLYLKNKLDLKDMPAMFEETRKKIAAGKHVSKPVAKHAKKEAKGTKKTSFKKSGKKKN